MRLAKLLETTINLVVYNPNMTLASQVDMDSYVAIDEADQILLDHAEDLSNKAVVAMSATSFSGDKVNERKHLERLRFTCLDSKIPGLIDPKTATSVASVEQFMAQSRGYAKLVFCEEPNFPSAYVTSINCKDVPRLRQLTRDDVMVITDSELTRGVDYRCASGTGTKGIALFVMRAVSN